MITIDKFSQRKGLEDSEGFIVKETEVFCKETSKTYIYVVRGMTTGWVEIV